MGKELTFSEALQGGWEKRRKGLCRARGRGGAPDCVGSHVRAKGCGLSACSYSCPNVEAIFGSAKGESFGGWLFTVGVEELDCLAVGQDVQESKEFTRM